MQAEIAAEAWPLQPQVLGVNETGHESSNAAMCNGRSLPWLQETAQERVWREWDVTYRDVIILDPENVPVGVFNLTDHDLSDPEDYQALRALLRQIAESSASKASR